MRLLFTVLSLVFLSIISTAQLPVTRYETSKGKESVTYYEAVQAWKQIDKISPIVSLLTMGATDANEPLHLVLVSSDQTFKPQQWQDKNKVVILINNGIHPGEPDGIDASISLVKDLISPPGRASPATAGGWGGLKLPFNVVLAIIPVYNIVGSNFRAPLIKFNTPSQTN